MSDRKFGGRLVGSDHPRDELLAAPRDASLFSHPGVARKRHIIAGDRGSACQGHALALSLAEPAEQVAAVLRCRRNGCKERWPQNAAS